MISTKLLRYNKVTIILILVLIAGCTQTYKQPIHDIKLPQTNDKLNIPIELIITEELQNAKWQRKRMGDTFKSSLGENLVYHTERMMNNIFMDVRISYKPNIISFDNIESYLMIPKFVSFGYARGASFIPETKTSITMQWQILKITGEHVWAETITGTYVGKDKEPSIEGNFQNFYKQTLIDLFQKTQEEILSSKLLRDLQ